MFRRGFFSSANTLWSDMKNNECVLLKNQHTTTKLRQGSYCLEHFKLLIPWLSKRVQTLNQPPVFQQLRFSCRFRKFFKTILIFGDYFFYKTQFKRHNFNFREFSGVEKEILKFLYFSGFPWPCQVDVFDSTLRKIVAMFCTRRLMRSLGSAAMGIRNKEWVKWFTVYIFVAYHFSYRVNLVSKAPIF